MHPQAREHMNRPSLQMATEPIGQLSDLIPIHPDRLPKYPKYPESLRQRRRDQRRQPKPDETSKVDDSQPHIDTYA